MSDSFPNFRSFPGTRRCEESPLADLAGGIACPTNTAPVVREVSFQFPKNYMTLGDCASPIACEQSFLTAPLAKALACCESLTRIHAGL